MSNSFKEIKVDQKMKPLWSISLIIIIMTIGKNDMSYMTDFILKLLNFYYNHKQCTISILAVSFSACFSPLPLSLFSSLPPSLSPSLSFALSLTIRLNYIFLCHTLQSIGKRNSHFFLVFPQFRNHFSSISIFV